VDPSNANPSVVAANRRVIEKAKAKNIKVLATLPARYCDADNNQAQVDAFTTAYKNDVIARVNDTFSGSAAVDAFEFGNEPNVLDTGCPDGVSRFRVAPNAFAWLLRSMWQWKTSNSRPELVVSGGLFNTYTTEPYWSGLFSSAAFTGFPGTRPFDYFGIHPYNNDYIDKPCIDAELTTCFYNWKVKTNSGLKAVANRVNQATGTTGSKLFATEFGFQLAICNTDNCVLNTFQQAAGYHAAGEALVNSAVTPLAIWNGYRDEGTDRFGVRGQWDAQNNTYTPRVATWNKFYSLAGGMGNTRPEACWATGSFFPLNFESSDARRTTRTYEWVWAYRGECAPAERAMGLSKSPATGGPRTLLCYKDPLDGEKYTHIHPFPDPYDPNGPDTDPSDNCAVIDVQAGSGHLPAGSPAPADWDPGNYKATCGPGRYVAALANSTTTRKLTHVLCCTAPVNQTAVSAQCSTVNFGTRESTVSGDWDSGAEKAECGVNRYMAGVSVTPTGNPNALLCCNQ
ncbi:MAG TPA: hypothetical protein VF815_38000, partial [Myxococcaceae bacterium]|jgi:hypothetical protein